MNEQTYPYRTPFTPRSIFDETFALIDENRGRADELRAPVLMYVSRDDKVIDWEAAIQYIEDCGAAYSRIEHPDFAGHALTIDHGWQLMALDVAAFCRADDPADTKSPSAEP